MQDQVVIVIPHYNESQRINLSEISTLAENTEIQLLLVNDGSTDNTLEILKKICASSPQKIHYLDFQKNMGKGEAIRQGIVHATEVLTPDIVGYVDADFSTPAEEVLRVLDTLRASHAKVAMGSRVQLLGRNIERNFARHILGRVFATIASLVLRLRVYDTQCGCKFFYCHQTKDVFEQPFLSRWIFDVEMILRLLQQKKFQETDFVEVPLTQWRDIQGSKLTKLFMIKSGFDLIRLWIKSRIESLR